MTVTNSASLLEQGIAIAKDGPRTLAQTYLRRAAEESPRDSNFWLWMAWLADSPAAMANCLEHLLAEQPDHPVAQDGLRWARGLMATIAGDATSPKFNRPQDEIDFNWTSSVDASPTASGECESHAVEILGVAIAAVEELVLDITPPPCYEDAYDDFNHEFPFEPTATLLPVNPPLADPVPADSALTDAPLADASPSEAGLAAPELLEAAPANEPVADDYWADPVESLTDESSDDAPLVELLLCDSLPVSTLESVVTEPPELPEKLLEDLQALAAEEERADGKVQFDSDTDVQIDAAQEASVVLLPLAVEAEPEPEIVESQSAATIDEFLEPVALEPPEPTAPQEIQKPDVPQDALVVDFAVEGSQHPIPEPIDESLPQIKPPSTDDETTNEDKETNTEMPCVPNTTEPVPVGLDNHCTLHLSSFEHQISLLHNPTSAEGRQQALQTARIILADTLEFLQTTQRQELLIRNRDEICRVLEEIKKVDQLLEWPSLWGLLGLRTAAKPTPQQAYTEVGVGYAALLDSLLTQIGSTIPNKSQAAEWDRSFRSLLADMKRRW